jgi:hypothetical protein
LGIALFAASESAALLKQFYILKKIFTPNTPIGDKQHKKACCKYNRPVPTPTNYYLQLKGNGIKMIGDC